MSKVLPGKALSSSRSARGERRATTGSQEGQRAKHAVPPLYFPSTDPLKEILRPVTPLHTITSAERRHRAVPLSLVHLKFVGSILAEFAHV